MKGVKGQVWVETVIYTLIAFIMIGLVLSYAKPKIEEFQDKTVIEQSVSIIKEIDSIIKEIEQRGAGNQRAIELEISKGSLTISGINDRLNFEIESRYQYSEPGTNLTEGNLMINTEKKGELYIIKLTKDYSERYNITYQQQDSLKTVSKSSSSYEVVISNKGGDSDGRTEINFEVN